MVARIALLMLLAGCSTGPDVHKAWSECLAFGGSAKFIATETVRQAECKIPAASPSEGRP